MSEETKWRPIPGHPGYLMSNHDEVFSLPRNGTTGGLMKQTLRKGRYPYVCLREHDVPSYCYISKLRQATWPDE